MLPLHILIVNATTKIEKDWAIFKNIDYGFSIEYPKEWEAYSHFEKDSQLVKFFNFGADSDSKFHAINATLLINTKNII